MTLSQHAREASLSEVLTSRAEWAAEYGMRHPADRWREYAARARAMETELTTLRQQLTEAQADRDDGVALIRAERLRQTEGATAEQDDGLTEGQLAESAALLIEYAQGNIANWDVLPCAKKLAERHQKDPVRLLTVAGAFIAAEIDRLRRSAARRASSSESGKPRLDMENLDV